MNQKNKNKIIILGNFETDIIKKLTDEEYWKFIDSDIQDMPPKNSKYNGWELLFYENPSNQYIFQKCSHFGFRNITILCFYEDNKKFELIKYFISKFNEDKIKFQDFPFFIILKEMNDESIENNYEQFIKKVANKNNEDNILKKMLFALKDSSLETYLSKINHMNKGYSNLYINEKDVKKFEDLTQYDLIIAEIKRQQIIFKDDNQMLTELEKKLNSKEFNNIMLFFDLNNKESSQIIFNVIKKMKKLNLTNNKHPFFIFYTTDKNINKKAIYDELSKFNEKFNKKQSLDIRNISVIYKPEDIYTTIISKYNYFNQIETNINIEYDKSNTINFLFAGYSNSGKTTFINRLLGEKRGLVNDCSKTTIYNTYYHKYLPLKFYDTQGFEIFKTEQNTDIINLINSYEKYFRNKDKVHVVFLVLKDDRLERLLDFIKFIMDKNISIFLIANKFQEEDYDIQRNNFNIEIEEFNSFNDKEKNYLKNHLYFVDLISEKCDEISKIISHISKEFSESKEAHNKIIMKFENDQKEEAAPPAENERLLQNNDEQKDLIHIEPEMNDNKFKNEKSLIKMNSEYEKLLKLSKFLRSNIKEYQAYKKEEALEIVEEYKTSNFFLGTIPIPYLDKSLTRNSRLKMINQIFEIYSPVFKSNNNKRGNANIDENEDEMQRALLNGLGDLSLAAGIGCEVASSLGFVSNILKAIPKLASGIAGVVVTLAISAGTGYKSMKDVETLGNQIIDYLEQEFIKLNIFDIYFDSAKKYNKTLEKLEKFASYFSNEHDIKYDCDIDYEGEIAPEPVIP